MQETREQILSRLADRFRDRYYDRLMYTVGLTRNHWEILKDGKCWRVEKAEAFDCARMILREESDLMASQGRTALALWLGSYHIERVRSWNAWRESGARS